MSATRVHAVIMPLLRWSLFILISILASCENKRAPVVIPSVFHWRNVTGSEVYAAPEIQRVYHKLLDIDWNSTHGAHPISVVPVPEAFKHHLDLIPCIYITNRTFQNIGDAAVDKLAANLLRKLRFGCPADLAGVMLDCDWSPSTRERFFRLTRAMNDSLDVPVISTIRLHQYAHPSKTGVPPADRGMLMPYNVGSVKEPGEVHSIFDEALASDYFRSNTPYPLPMDIALPAFSWGVQFRKGQFMGILQESQIDRALEFGLLSAATGVVQVIREDNDDLPELHLGDEIRIEWMTPELIAAAASLAQHAVNSDTLAIAFFEMHSPTFEKIDPLHMQNILNGFGTIRQAPIHQTAGQ